jgi:hypothetical protein
LDGEAVSEEQFLSMSFNDLFTARPMLCEWRFARCSSQSHLFCSWNKDNNKKAVTVFVINILLTKVPSRLAQR